MLNKLTNILKRLIVGFLMLYGYNILVPAAAIIPINIITVILLTIFGFPGLIVLIIIKVLIY
ncbi:MAG: hypothetical protein HFH46_00525 [Bacilli bacterium]|nr:hypothetical protein [Bacilli bacterium]MCI9586140.1 hypothetical protein [Bacilli bacterium]